MRVFEHPNLMYTNGMRWLALVFATMQLVGAEEPWARHTIDDTSRGADGVRLADVNGDGLMDIATGWEEGGVVRAYLHPQRGKEKDPWPMVTSGEVKSPEDAVFADLDGDGAIDVVSSCEGRTRTMYVHWAPEDYLDGPGWKTEPIPATARKQSWMYALPMDIDGKNGIDLIVSSKGGGAAVGWLEAPENARDLNAWKLHKLQDAGWIMSLIAADMDGDGDHDVLVSDRRGKKRGIFWLEFPGKEAPHGEWKRHDIGGSNREIFFISRGDVDQDGQDDIVAMDRGNVVWYQNRSDGWKEHVIPLPDGVGSGKSAALADIDGDGRNDIVFSCENAAGERSGMRWLSWENSPTDGSWTSHEIGGPEGHKYDRVVLHDVDGDGDEDVVCCEERDGLGVFWYENPFGAKSPKTNRPNIILIMADDVGSEVLGCYGGESYPTPNLDKLAVGGMRFEHAYSMAVCHPTRVCLMTGKYPTTLGNPKWGSFPRKEEANSIGNVLKRAGYRTAVAGKWQLSLMKRDKQQPARMGFDEWCLFGWHEGPRFNDPFLYQNGEVRTDTKGKFGPDLYTEFLIDFMKRSGDEPFFAYFPMAVCHDVTDDVKEPVPFYKDGRWMTFAEMVKVMDDKVGEIVAAVEQMGAAKNTLILFTTDNGSPSGSYITVRNGKMVKDPVFSMRNGEKIHGGKGRLKDRGTRVPLIASWPGTIEPGQLVGDLVDMSDYLPTLAQIANATTAGNVDGISFATRLRGAGRSPRKWAYAEHKGRRFVRTRDWKLYSNGKLFDVKNDPEERKPVAEHPSRKALEEALAGVR